MKVYKYRDLSRPSDRDFQRLATIMHRRAFWCARPDTLNDPEELAWLGDFSATGETVELLSNLLVVARGRSWAEAREKAAQAVRSEALERLAQPVITDLIEQCRNEVGLVCFGTSPDNDVLWQRYGGNGSGVCVELEVPDHLLGTQLFNVQYLGAKRIHIDQLVRAFLDRRKVVEVYGLALLSKPLFWRDEVEVRFVSKRQGVQVVIEDSRITRLFAGDLLPPSLIDRIKVEAGGLPVVARAGTVVSSRGHR